MPENRIGQGNLGNAFARLYQLDDLNAIPGVAPEILPVSSIWERPELWALTGGTLGAIRSQAAAPGAGQARYLGLWNPATSGSLLVVEQLIIATAILIIWGTRLAGSVGTPIGHRDTRKRIPPGFFGMAAGAEVNFGATGTILSATLGAMTGPAIVPLDYVIQPGDGFAVQAPDNTAIDVTLHARCRAAADTELLLR
jgi:hypothetical protein